MLLSVPEPRGRYHQRKIHTNLEEDTNEGMREQCLGAVLLACNAAAAVHLKTKQINMLVLPKIKTAANVDMVCFDKTGTLTESEKRQRFCCVSCLLP